MGNDFIRQKAGSFEKSWKNGSEELSRQDLFTRYPECHSRTVVASLLPHQVVVVGDPVLLQINDCHLDVFKSTTLVATVENPANELFQAILDNGGVALGEVSQFHQLSETADVCVQR